MHSPRAGFKPHIAVEILSFTLDLFPRPSFCSLPRALGFTVIEDSSDEDADEVPAVKEAAPAAKEAADAAAATESSAAESSAAESSAAEDATAAPAAAKAHGKKKKKKKTEKSSKQDSDDELMTSEDSDEDPLAGKGAPLFHDFRHSKMHVSQRNISQRVAHCTHSQLLDAVSG